MALGTSSSRVLGLVREILFAALFPRSITDAWNAAFRLPNLFRRLLGEGSLSISFIPIYIEAKTIDGQLGERAKNLRDGFFTLLSLCLFVITTLGILYAPSLLKIILDASYIAETEKFLMTVRMAQIMFGFIFLVSLYALAMALLNTAGYFGLPAMAPALFNVALIISTLLPPHYFAVPTDGLAWGVIVGGILQLLILIPSLVKSGLLPKFRIVWNEDIKKVLLNMVPGLFSLGVLQISLIINTRFASRLGEGPISWINWADRLLELPLSLIAVSLGTALLPRLSQHWSRGEHEEMKQTLMQALKFNLFICLCAAAGLYALARPIVEVLFQRGQFTSEDAAATAQVVKIWALIMIPTSCVRLLAPAFYAVKNTWLTPTAAAVCLLIHVLLAPVLMEQWGLFGLNISSLVTALVNFFILYLCYQYFVVSLNHRELFFAFIKYFIPSALLALSAFYVHDFVRPYFVSHLTWTFAVHFLSLVISGLVGVLTFVAYAMLFQMKEWDQVKQRLVGLKRRRS